MERLVVQLGTARPGAVRDALARALGDPSLELAYCVRPGVYVDRDGRPASLPAAGSGRTASIIRRDGEEVAALVHDEAIAGDPLLEPVGAAAALENERLNAELRARLEDMRASVRASFAPPMKRATARAEASTTARNSGSSRLHSPFASLRRK